MYGGVLDSMLLATGDVASVAVARCLRADERVSDVAANWTDGQYSLLSAWRLAYLAKRQSACCSERLRSHLQYDHASCREGETCVEKLLINDHGPIEIL